MYTSRVELIEREHSFTREIVTKPYTFFSLDASEKMKYNAFHEKHNNLEDRIRKIRGEGREIEKEEREAGEREVREMFIDLIKPHLEQCGLKAARCFAYYGENKETFVETPSYDLFENKEPFDAALRVVYWFSTKDETLSCTSNLGYATGGSGGNFSQKYVVYDLLRKVIGERKQDGYTFPIVSFRGDFVCFASSGFARSLMGLIREILEKVGPQAMEELNILHRENIIQRSRGEGSDMTIQQRVFQEAYKQKLWAEIIRAGFYQTEFDSSKIIEA